eukprot:gene16891-23171_t
MPISDLVPLLVRLEPLLEYEQHSDSFYYSDESLSAAALTVEMANQFMPEELARYGTEHCQWVGFLKGFKSASVYENRVNHFLSFHWMQEGNECSKEEIQSSLVSYFEMHHNELKEDGTARFAPTTMRTWLSMIGKFWEFTQRGDLKAQMLPLLESQLGKWEKGYCVKKAKTFSNADLVLLHKLEDTEVTLVWKALFASVAIAFAARSCEIINLDWADIVKLKDIVKEEYFYKIQFKRAAKTTTALYGFLPNYRMIFPQNFQKKGVLRSTKTAIGKNLLSAFPSRIAQMIGLPEFTLYTGHCWRRTTATLAAAKKGMTVPQIKQITGHRSDTV